MKKIFLYGERQFLGHQRLRGKVYQTQILCLQSNSLIVNFIVIDSSVSIYLDGFIFFLLQGVYIRFD